MSIMSFLGRGTPKQFVEEILFFSSCKQASSLAVHRQGLVFSIKSAGVVDEYVKLCMRC